jgi:hypothetical protein
MVSPGSAKMHESYRRAIQLARQELTRRPADPNIRSATNDPVNPGRFTLDLGNVKIKNSGDWDWGLMVQMVLPGGAIKCFSSDPEMEVGS